MLVAFLLLGAQLASADTLTGHPRIAAADTLAFGSERVWLQDIDAPEKHQQCHLADGNPYACDQAPAKLLYSRIGAGAVR